MARTLSLLIVEDEEAILRGLVDEFESQGYSVDFSWDGEIGLQKALDHEYDLLLLDVNLPNRDGFSICEEVRKEKPEQAIIMLTAKDTEEDRINGFTAGADDYVSKPFSLKELVLRVDAILRRSGRKFTNDYELEIGPELSIDTRNLVGKRKDESISFTRREIEILQYLRTHKDRPVSRGELLVEVWGYARARAIQTRTVDIHIAKLRKKIEPNFKQPSYLITVRGEGYKLLDTPENAEDTIAYKACA